MIPDEQYAALHAAAPDPKMDDPAVSSFWRRRAALTLGLHANAPWVDIIGWAEHREYRRDVAFAGELALRHLRIEVERLTAEVEALPAERRVTS